MLLLVLIACGKGRAANHEGVYELSFNIQVPATHQFHKEVVQPWADFVEQETNGRVVVNIYNSAALGTLSTGYEDIQGGVYDIGYVSPSLHPDTELFPLSIADLPFGLADPFDNTKVMTPFIDEYVKETTEGIVTLGMSSTDSYQLYSKRPVETIEDVENRKIIVSGYQRVSLIDLWESVPVSLGVEEIYMALDRNTVDQATYTSIGAMGLKLFETAPYLTKVDMGSTALLYLMNENTFEALPAELQKQFEEQLAPALIENSNKLYGGAAEQSFVDFEKQVAGTGGRVIKPSEAELAEFKKPAESIWKEWVEQANAKGYDGEEMMEFYRAHLSKAGITLPF